MKCEPEISRRGEALRSTLLLITTQYVAYGSGRDRCCCPMFSVHSTRLHTGGRVGRSRHCPSRSGSQMQRGLPLVALFAVGSHSTLIEESNGFEYYSTELGSCGSSFSGTTAGFDNWVQQPSPENWFLFKAPGTGTATFASCGSSFDTFVRIYETSTSGTIGPLSDQIAYCDDANGAGGSYVRCQSCQMLMSQLTWRIESGRQYLMAVEGYSSNQGPYQVSLSCDLAPLPPPSPPSPPAIPVCPVSIDLVFVLDRSGSMGYDTGVVPAVRQLLTYLSSMFILEDGYARLAIVEFSTSANVVTDLTTER